MPATRSLWERNPRRWLSGPALELYQHLEALGEIRRLKEMPQLGTEGRVRPQERQTRWDYVALMLRLAARIAPLDSLFEEYGKVQIEGHRVGAGRDLIQCWAMLVNCGHLWGTFATERLVLDALAARGKARTHFLEGLPGEVERGYARWVIDHYLLYKLAPPVAMGFVHCLAAHREAPGRAMWLAMLRAFCVHGDYGFKIIQLWRAYQLLRRLAYLHLDLAHAHLPVAVDIAAVERDPAHHLGDILVRESGPLHALLESLNRYIPPQVHLAPDMVLARRLLQVRAGARVQEELSGAGSAEELFAKLEAMRSEDVWPAAVEARETVARGEYAHLHRVAGPRDTSVEPKVFWAQTPRLQARLSRLVGERGLVHVSAGDLVEGRLIDFFVGKDISPSDLARVLAVVCEMVMRPRGRPRRPRGGAEVRDLAAAVLTLMLRQSEQVRTRDHGELSADESFLLVDGPRAHLVAKRLEGPLAACREAGRRRELEVLAGSLAKRSVEGFRAVMLNGFEVVRQAESPAGSVEFAGAYIDVGREDATLYVVSAEGGPAPHAAARQLRGRLRRLGWLKAAEIVVLEGGAEAAVSIRPRGRG